VSYLLIAIYIVSQSPRLKIDFVRPHFLSQFGKTTYLITTFQRVPRGTEGAVSLEGTAAGVVGSLILSLLGLKAGMISSWVDLAIISGLCAKL